MRRARRRVLGEVADRRRAARSRRRRARRTRGLGLRARKEGSRAHLCPGQLQLPVRKGSMRYREQRCRSGSICAMMALSRRR